MKRNGHSFYFRWDDQNENKMLFRAYLMAVDPGSVFDAEGLRRLKHEVDTMPEEGMRENFYPE
jgi:hypothetical protein